MQLRRTAVDLNGFGALGALGGALGFHLQINVIDIDGRMILLTFGRQVVGCSIGFILYPGYPLLGYILGRHGFLGPHGFLGCPLGRHGFLGPHGFLGCPFGCHGPLIGCHSPILTGC